MDGKQVAWAGGCCLVLVVLALIFVLVTIVVPTFRFPRDEFKEAEVKQNLHAIQLALERYAVDNGGHYPMFVMGGDWTDSYVATEEWVGLQPELDVGMIEKYQFSGEWRPAPAGMGDALVMEAYMPSFPGNPFIKTKSSTILPVIEHYSAFGEITKRYVGGRTSDKMVEVFGPQIVRGGQQVAGDYFVHHIYNNPPYLISEIRKETTDTGPVDFSNPSGNSLLVGNFSYFPRPAKDMPPWVVRREVEGPDARLVLGYTLAGYGSVRTPGQDVYNRNGNYKGRYRTEDCATDCSEHQLFPDDVPCICPGETAQPSHLKNNGGSDTLPDGVIITLDSGMKQGRFGKVLPGDDDPTPPAGPK